MIAISILAWTGAAIALLGLMHELANLSFFPVLRPNRSDAERVVACIATRNEERSIESCVVSLLNQPEIVRIIVVDDDSNDATRAVVEALARKTDKIELRAARGEGKCAALAVAADAACDHPHTAVLFVDADTRLEAGAAAALLAYRRQTGAQAASVWPRTHARSVWDVIFSNAVILFLLQGLSLKLAREHPSPLFAAANGQVLLVDRDAYDRCGGHRAIRGIVEDVELARRLKASGFRVALASGAHIAHALGYGSLAGNASGYGRSLLHGAGRSGAVAFFLWQLLAFALPWVLLIYAPVPAFVSLAASFFANGLVRSRMNGMRALLASWTFGAWFVCVAAGVTALQTSPTVWKGRTHTKENRL